MLGESDADRAFLLAHDSDPFSRWDAGQALLTVLLLRLYNIATQSKVNPKILGLKGKDSIRYLEGLPCVRLGPPHCAAAAPVQGCDTVQLKVSALTCQPISNSTCMCIC